MVAGQQRQQEQQQGRSRRRRSTSSTSSSLASARILLLCLASLLLLAVEAWQAPRPGPLSMTTTGSSSPQHQRKGTAAVDRRALLGQKALALSLGASPLLLSIVGGRPLPARAADEAKKEAAIQVGKRGSACDIH